MNFSHILLYTLVHCSINLYEMLDLHIKYIFNVDKNSKKYVLSHFSLCFFSYYGFLVYAFGNMLKFDT